VHPRMTPFGEFITMDGQRLERRTLLRCPAFLPGPRQFLKGPPAD